MHDRKCYVSLDSAKALTRDGQLLAGGQIGHTHESSIREELAQEQAA